MGIITKIEQQKNKNRVNIFIDDSFFCGLELETAMLFNLKVGKEVDETVLDKALFESEKKRAFEKAMDYLSIRMHSKKELHDKLQKKGFSENVIKGSFDKLIEYNYIDDTAFAREFVNQNRKYSKLALKNKLIQRGIQTSIIEEVLKNFDSKDELEICKKYAEKYIKSANHTQSNAKQKIFASLARKGFSYEIITQVLNDANFYGEFDSNDW